MYVCMDVCVKERKREGERERDRERDKQKGGKMSNRDNKWMEGRKRDRRTTTN